MATHLPSGQRQCVGKIRNGPRKGEQCGQPAIEGATCCRHHLKDKTARANAAVRAEIAHWLPGDMVDDPGETLLRLVTQSRRRAEKLAHEIYLAVEQAGSLEAAMVGDSYTVTAEGKSVKVGEYIRGLTQLESAERDRCARFAERAVAAGLAERQVRLAERQGELLNELLDAVLRDLGVPDDLVDQVPELIDRHLELVAG